MKFVGVFRERQKGCKVGWQADSKERGGEEWEGLLCSKGSTERKGRRIGKGEWGVKEMMSGS